MTSESTGSESMSAKRTASERAMSSDGVPSDTLTVLYFASLRDAVGSGTETVVADVADLRALYLRLQARHGFALPVERLRVAVDGAFARWDDAPRAGSEVAFIPPVSGG